MTDLQSSHDPSTPAVHTEAMKPARPPVGTGAAPLVAQLLALAVAALGVLGIQEALVRSGAVGVPSWTSAILDAADGRTAAAWTVVAGAVLVLVGLVLLLVVVKRRPRKSLTVRAETGVYLRTGDLARLVETNLEGIDGVTHTRVEPSLRRLRIQATTFTAPGDTGGVARTIEERTRPTLEAFAKPPRLKVKVKNEENA